MPGVLAILIKDQLWRCFLGWRVRDPSPEQPLDPGQALDLEDRFGADPQFLRHDGEVLLRLPDAAVQPVERVELVTPLAQVNRIGALGQKGRNHPGRGFLRLRLAEKDRSRVGVPAAAAEQEDADLSTTAGVDEFWFCGSSVIVWRAAGVVVASPTRRARGWGRAAWPRRDAR